MTESLPRCQKAPQLNLVKVSLLGVIGTIYLFSMRASAQSIQSANDSLGTTIDQQGQQFNILGGTIAGQNLLHSFEQFGLTQGDIANFLTDPEIQNVLSRVVSGDASIIDGQIQLSGSNANLFLMNPGGIIFGENASLNVPGAFTATTANSIEFANGSFNAIGDIDLQGIIGNPTGLNFAQSNGGSIINAGDLGVDEGQSLSLVGSAVVNTGSLSAPDGEITIAAIPGGNKVRISAAGTVLGLGIDVDTLQTDSDTSLAQMVVGASDSVATGISVEPDGSIRLTASGQQVPVEAGTAAVAGEVDAASSISDGGQIHVLGNQVALVDANLNASGQTGGGTVLIGGDFQGQGDLPNSTQTFVGPDTKIVANAVTGDGGRVILWSDGSTEFYGSIEAQAGQTMGDGGFVEVSGLEHLTYQGIVDTTALNGANGTLLLDPTDITITPGAATEPFDGQVLAGDPAPTTITQFQIQALPGTTDVIIQATNSITIEPLINGSLEFQPGTGTISFEAGGAFSLAPGNSITTAARDISIQAGSIDIGNINASTEGIPTMNIGALFGPAGDITLISTSGDINTGFLNLSGGTPGTLVVDADDSSFSATSVDVQQITMFGGGQPGSITIDALGGVNILSLENDFSQVLVNGMLETGDGSLIVPGTSIGQPSPGNGGGLSPGNGGGSSPGNGGSINTPSPTSPGLPGLSGVDLITDVSSGIQNIGSQSRLPFPDPLKLAIATVENPSLAGLIAAPIPFTETMTDIRQRDFVISTDNEISAISELLND